MRLHKPSNHKLAYSVSAGEMQIDEATLHEWRSIIDDLLEEQALEVVKMRDGLVRRLIFIKDVTQLFSQRV